MTLSKAELRDMVANVDASKVRVIKAGKKSKVKIHLRDDRQARDVETGEVVHRSRRLQGVAVHGCQILPVASAQRQLPCFNTAKAWVHSYELVPAR